MPSITRLMRLLCAALLALTSPVTEAKDGDECTAILVGAKASSNGAPMTTHTNDCSSCDFRISKVPQRRHSPNAVHDVMLAKKTYPQYIGTTRGKTFLPEYVDTSLYNWTAAAPIGQIPEVNLTFAYLNGLYGIMNEHQLAMGESTCGARLASKPLGFGGQALFDIRELSRLAMQRTTTARDAIKLMGSLSEQYGYYGNGWDGSGALAEAGEALTITDTREAWMFHILPDDTGASAVWVAQRVPDDHVAAVANQFVIHQVNLSDSDNFLGSSNLQEVALRSQLWNGQGPFDFTNIYALPRNHSSHYYSNSNPYYSTRRVWRVMMLSNPDLTLSPYTDIFATDYPFSVPVKQPLLPADLMRFQRDHYEGTSFDMTKGPSSGPYGNPDRYDLGANGNMSVTEAGSGRFERAISIFRASYTFVTVLDANNSDHAVLWFGQYAPHATTYVPIYAKVHEVPQVFATGSLHKYDRQHSFFWANAVVGNWASRFYMFAIPFVQEVQTQLESTAIAAQAIIQRQAEVMKQTKGDAALRAFLTLTSRTYADQAHHRVLQLFDDLVTTFHDGYQIAGLRADALSVTPLFYPKWWLEQVGYFQQDQVDAANLKLEFQQLSIDHLDMDNVWRIDVALVALGTMISATLGFVLGIAYRTCGERSSYREIQ